MTGFTPELVSRVRMAVWNAVEDMHGDIRTGAQSDVIADAALEASGIAELTEALLWIEEEAHVTRDHRDAPSFNRIRARAIFALASLGFQGASQGACPENSAEPEKSTDASPRNSTELH